MRIRLSIFIHEYGLFRIFIYGLRHTDKGTNYVQTKERLISTQHKKHTT
jgi:hypothetical protein